MFLPEVSKWPEDFVMSIRITVGGRFSLKKHDATPLIKHHKDFHNRAAT